MRYRYIKLIYGSESSIITPSISNLSFLSMIIGWGYISEIKLLTT